MKHTMAQKIPEKEPLIPPQPTEEINHGSLSIEPNLSILNRNVQSQHNPAIMHGIDNLGIALSHETSAAPSSSTWVDVSLQGAAALATELSQESMTAKSLNETQSETAVPKHERPIFMLMKTFRKK